MIYFFELYFLIAQLFLAGKDAMSYRLRNVNTDPLTLARLARWHRDGAILAFLYWLPAFALTLVQAGISLVAALLIRLTVYDIEFNKSASLPLSYLGTTPKADSLFIKWFGSSGALQKSLIALALLIILNVWLIFFLRIKLL